MRRIIYLLMCLPFLLLCAASQGHTAKNVTAHEALPVAPQAAEAGDFSATTTTGENTADEVFFRTEQLVDNPVVACPVVLAADKATMPAYDPAWEFLIIRLVGDGFDPVEVRSLFASLGETSYSPAYMAAKIAELHGVGGIGITRKEENAPAVPEGYEQPLSNFSIGGCRELAAKYSKELADIEEKHGVPARVILGLLLVETGLGSDLGNNVALRSLAGIAATTTPERLGSEGNGNQPLRVRPAALASTLKDKSDWAYNEVKALIRYGKKSGADISKLPGSMYGAVGICQFMPSNIALYGEDGDGDGKVDVFSVVDAMYSVANYLEANGWREAKTPQQQFMVIRTYNHDDVYAARVLGTAGQVELALTGKMRASGSLFAGIGPASPRSLDPSLRRLRSVPVSARISSLGSYQSLME